VTEPAALRQTPWILRALLLTSKERIGKRREGNKEEGRAGGMEERGREERRGGGERRGRRRGNWMGACTHWNFRKSAPMQDGQRVNNCCTQSTAPTNRKVVDRLLTSE